MMIFGFNKEEKKKSEKNLSISTNLMLKSIVIKKNFNISHLMCLMIFV